MYTLHEIYILAIIIQTCPILILFLSQMLAQAHVCLFSIHRAHLTYSSWEGAPNLS